MSNFYLNEHDVVFIHIPKTGGLSIRKGFFNTNYQKINRHKLERHFSHCFSFAFKRNPYDRLISAWKMLTRDWQKLPQLSLTDFCKIVTNENIKWNSGNTFKNYEVSVRHHTLPQTHRFNCLDLAKFVGEFDNLDKEFEKICSIIKCEYKPLPVINKSQFDKNYLQHLNQETLDIANQYYSKDFELLGYQKINALP